MAKKAARKAAGRVEMARKAGAKSKVGGVSMMDWLLFAVAGMVFLALSNIALKLLVDKAAKTTVNLVPFVPAVALVLAAIVFAMAFLLVNGTVSLDLVVLAAAFALLSTVAFTGVALAMQGGKVAVVTALMSISTVVVAVISFVFLGDRFTLKELAAMAFAIASVAMLAS